MGFWFLDKRGCEVLPRTLAAQYGGVSDTLDGSKFAGWDRESVLCLGFTLRDRRFRHGAWERPWVGYEHHGWIPFMTKDPFGTYIIDF